MPLRQLTLLLLAPALLVSPGARAGALAPESSPRVVVRALYAHHFAHDMAFTETSVRAKEPWLAPDLLAACLAYLARPSDPNEAPLVDGDPFTDSQEYPRHFEVGEPEQLTASIARVPVTFKGRHLKKRVDVILTLVQNEWKVSDVGDERGGSLALLLGAGATQAR